MKNPLRLVILWTKDLQWIFHGQKTFKTSAFFDKPFEDKMPSKGPIQRVIQVQIKDHLSTQFIKRDLNV